MFVWLLLAPSAQAGGYYLSDSGIVATGRGGAWVAGADTRFAQHFNPAGLVRIKAPVFDLGVSAVTQSVRFERQCPDPLFTTVEPCATEGADFYPEVKNEAPPLPIPQIGFAAPLGDRAGFAIGFYSPFAPAASYPADGPQRYSLKELSIVQFTVGPSVAVRLHDMLSLGLGLQWQFFQLQTDLDVTVGGRDVLNGDVASTLKATDAFTPNVNAGLLFEPLDEVSVGISVQPSTRFEAHGPLAIDFTGSAQAELMNTTAYTDDDILLSITLPWVVRAGVAVRPVPKLEIEAAAVWQDWSTLKEIAVTDLSIPLDSDSEDIPEVVDDDISLPAGLSDTISIRLGGEARVDDALAVRAGGFWENSAATPQQVSVQLVDTSKVQIGMGGSLFLADERLRIDAALAWLFLQNLEIRDSTVVQVDSGAFELPNGPLVVGNGNLSSHGWILGLGAQWTFGQRGE